MKHEMWRFAVLGVALAVIASLVIARHSINHGTDEVVPVSTSTPVALSTPVPSGCGQGNTKVLIPDPANCKVICEVPLLKGHLKDGGPEIYWRQGAMQCITRCKGDWEPIVQEWTDTPECGGSPVLPTATSTPTIKKKQK